MNKLFATIGVKWEEEINHKSCFVDQMLSLDNSRVIVSFLFLIKFHIYAYTFLKTSAH